MARLTWKADKVLELCGKAEAGEAATGWDGEVLPPSLSFVKDDGVYLMPHRVYGEGESPMSTGEVIYARGYNPAAASYTWDKGQEACGGDDFSEQIPTSEIRELMGRVPADVTITSFTIELTATQMSFSLRGKGPRQRK